MHAVLLHPTAISEVTQPKVTYPHASPSAFNFQQAKLCQVLSPNSHKFLPLSFWVLKCIKEQQMSEVDVEAWHFSRQQPDQQVNMKFFWITPKYRIAC